MGCLKLPYQPQLKVHEQNSFLIERGLGKKDHEVKKCLSSYTFGFNGYEREDEVAGQGSVIDFGMRVYDSRLGKFFSVDPIVYPYWSPYQYDGNSPTSRKDILGMGLFEGFKKRLSEYKENRQLKKFEKSHPGEEYYKDATELLNQFTVSANKPENKVNEKSFVDGMNKGGDNLRLYLLETTNAFIDGKFDIFLENVMPPIGMQVLDGSESYEPAKLPTSSYEMGEFTFSILPMVLTKGRGRASSLSTIKRGSKQWKNAVQQLSSAKRGKINIRVATASDAKALLQEARGNMNRYKNYTKDKGTTYKKGYETHNVQNARELGAGNDLQHIKWKDSKSGGHIYYDKPN